MSTPVRVSKGHFNGSIGTGATNPPATAPKSGTLFELDPYETNIRPQFVMAGTNEFNRGSIMPGDTYTGVTIFYRDPKTGHERVEWSGELHGSWHSDTPKSDPATDLIASLKVAADGALAHRVEFRRPSKSLPNTTEVKNLPLVGGGFSEVQQRACRR